MKQALLRQLRLYAAPGSLRLQLLLRSLLVVAFLLLLIGISQYFFMRNVVYSNKAENLHSLVMSMPRPLMQKGAPQPITAAGNLNGEPVPALAEGDGARPDAAQAPPAAADGQTAPGYLGAMDPDSAVPGTANPGNGEMAPEDAVPGEDNGRYRYFMPDFSLAYVDEDGVFYDLTDNPAGAAAPRLDPEVYRSARGAGEPQTQSSYMIIDNQGQEELVVIDEVQGGPGGHTGLVQISTATAPLKELLIRQLAVFVLLASLAMLLALVALLPVLKRTMVPLSNMVELSTRIDAGNLDSRFPEKQGQAEIDQLAESFNGMMERLEASFLAEQETKEQMRRFIADASHELRTPLTSIHGFIEVLLRGAAEQPEQLNKCLQSMLGESTRLRSLVQDLIVLTRLDSAPDLELRPGSLSAVLTGMEAQLLLLTDRRCLKLDIEEGLTGRFNADQVKQVVLNLVQNAVQHTSPVDGKICVALTREGNDALLSVADNGPGIGADHLPHVFDRFYRSDSSRARKHGGSGLGLAITRSIVEAHGGSINAESQPGHGCRFHVRLPVFVA